MKVSDINPFAYRAQPEVRAALQKAATQEGRSVNSQLDRYVRQGLEKDGIKIAKPKKDNAPGAQTPEASVVKSTPLSRKEEATK